MKLLFALFLIFSAPLWAQELQCQRSDSGFQSCSTGMPPDQLECTPSAVKANQQLNDLNKIADDGAPEICSANEVLMGASQEELAKIQDNLSKQCKRKAKEYKKAVFKQLLKEFKLGRAFQALLKRKSKLYTAKAVKGKTQEVSVEGSLEEFNNMDAAQLNQHILDKIYEQFPDAKEMVERAKGDPSFKYGFHENEDIVYNLMVARGDEKACTFPPLSVPERKAAPLQDYKESDIVDNFEDDCAYMVSSNYSESQALKALSSKDRAAYCNKSDMKAKDDGLDAINDVRDQLCQVAKDGMTPQYTIETSRNLYRDRTENLAAKRGEFVQDYLRNELKKCDVPDGLPSWITDEKEFAARIQISHPSYEGAEAGNYGPNPYADGAAQANEIQKFERSLRNERSALTEELGNENAQAGLKGQLAKVKQEKEEVLAKIADLKKTFSELENKMKQTKDVAKIKEQYDELSSLTATIQNFYHSLDSLDQEIHASTQKIHTIQEKLTASQSDEAIKNKVELLRQFYAEKNANGGNVMNIKKKWDEKLFNQFKMAKISGIATNDSLIPRDVEATPELDLALNALVRLDQFTCVMEPMKTKSKHLLPKIGLGIAAPIVGVVGAAARALFAVPATLIDLAGGCRNCDDPGKVLPSFFINSSFKKLQLKDFFRHKPGKKMMDGLDSYFTLGGKLSSDTNYESLHLAAQDYYKKNFKKFDNENTVNCGYAKADCYKIRGKTVTKEEFTEYMLEQSKK